MKYLKSIQELYEWSNLTKILSSEAFDILTFEELPDTTKTNLPPHRRNFYTILYFENQDKGNLLIDGSQYSALNNSLVFHNNIDVFSFTRTKNATGCVLLFHPEFLLPNSNNIKEDFPFFQSQALHSIKLNDKDIATVKQLFNILHQNKNNPKTCKHLLLAILHKCNEFLHKEVNNMSVSKLITLTFLSNLNTFCYQEKNVSYYAKLQHIAPNYLNEVVKRETNKSAKKWINEKILLESKNLLQYSTLNISEISATLSFAEPSHFIRFFKKETQLTPKQYKNQKH